MLSWVACASSLPVLTYESSLCLPLAWPYCICYPPKSNSSYLSPCLSNTVLIALYMLFLHTAYLPLFKMKVFCLGWSSIFNRLCHLFLRALGENWGTHCILQVFTSKIKFEWVNIESFWQATIFCHAQCALFCPNFWGKNKDVHYTWV